MLTEARDRDRWPAPHLLGHVRADAKCRRAVTARRDVFEDDLRRESPLQPFERGVVAARGEHAIVVAACSFHDRLQQLLKPQTRLGGAVAREIPSAPDISEAAARGDRPHLGDMHDGVAREHRLDHLARASTALIVGAGRHHDDHRHGGLPLAQVSAGFDDGVEDVALAVGHREQLIDGARESRRVARVIDDAERPVAERVQGDIAARQAIDQLADRLSHLRERRPRRRGRIDQDRDRIRGRSGADRLAPGRPFLDDEVVGPETGDGRIGLRIDDARQHVPARRLHGEHRRRAEQGDQGQHVHRHRGATPRPRIRAPTIRMPTFTSFGFDPTGTRYSIIISLVSRSARRSSAAWYDAAE